MIKNIENMIEMEKLQVGLPYSMWDEEGNGQKLAANAGCNRGNSLDNADKHVLEAAIRDLFGKVGKELVVAPIFNCGSRTNIEVAENFLTNYNATILDMAKVTMGNDVLIGPNTMISTLNHPITPKGRHDHLGLAYP